LDPIHQLLAAVILPFINTFWLDWDCVRLDCTPVVEADQIAVFLGAPVYRVSKMRKKGNYFGTHMTLYRSDRRKRILTHLESNTLHDADMSMAKNAQGLNCLVFNPGVCCQNRKLKSDNLYASPKPHRAPGMSGSTKATAAAAAATATAGSV
jgi:hypothetical protein